MDTGKVLLGVLSGVAIGATLGILFAPDKGSSTRRKIYKKGEMYPEEVKATVNAYIDSLAKKFEVMSEEVFHSHKSEKVKSDGEKAAVAR